MTNLHAKAQAKILSSRTKYIRIGRPTLSHRQEPSPGDTLSRWAFVVQTIGDELRANYFVRGVSMKSTKWLWL
jgi:hypothetical protein